ncbi:hypothetical protein BOTBODRAFT_31814 [Botryobasidium botryosum FD-172 SS1]|uniref:Uncharacterized protein n=1 Tax=Botryobasidium botryosum (strain FD-172 SS1) TaxID=930990 RepID=A0A067MI93_BOTB1|nr:hypothetical protein BOTBODRAFT_31814 [Botryobasidium botryosum FD-172 SS1]
MSQGTRAGAMSSAYKAWLVSSYSSYLPVLPFQRPAHALHVSTSASPLIMNFTSVFYAVLCAAALAQAAPLNMRQDDGIGATIDLDGNPISVGL